MVITSIYVNGVLMENLVANGVSTYTTATISISWYTSNQYYTPPKDIYSPGYYTTQGYFRVALSIAAEEATYITIHDNIYNTNRTLTIPQGSSAATTGILSYKGTSTNSAYFVSVSGATAKTGLFSTSPLKLYYSSVV